MKFLVIDLGGTFFKYALMDENGTIIEKGKIKSQTENEEQMIASFDELYKPYEGKVDGIAISAPGVIDSRTGFMHTGGAFFWVKDFPLAEILSKRYGIPVTVENDGKSAAGAELWKGALSDCDSGVAIVIGTAIGGAVIINREIIRGSHLMAGEFSYQFAEASGCNDVASIVGFLNGVPALLRIVSEKKQIPVEELTGEKVFEWANAGDEEAMEALREYCMRIAVLISNLQYTIDPQRFVIGGGISVQPILVQTIREQLIKLDQTFWMRMPIPEVTTCKYYNDANLMGALYVHLKNRGLI